MDDDVGDLVKGLERRQKAAAAAVGPQPRHPVVSGRAGGRTGQSEGWGAEGRAGGRRRSLEVSGGQQGSVEVSGF